MQRNRFPGDLLFTHFDRSGNLSDADDKRDKFELCHLLLSSEWEVSEQKLASNVLNRYRALAPDQKPAFFHPAMPDEPLIFVEKDLTKTIHGSVARFHLGDGAQVYDVHAEADISANGIVQSSGAIVSYLYDLSMTETNHAGFASAAIIATAKSAKGLSTVAFVGNTSRHQTVSFSHKHRALRAHRII